MELHSTLETIIKGYSGTISVHVKNFLDGENLAIDEYRIYPSASTIKLVILAQAMAEVDSGAIHLDDFIELTDEDMVGGDGVLKELAPGHNFSILELLTLMIIVSDNTATNILIKLLGMDSVNRMASALGLNSTRLRRLMMDAEARKAGRENETCAYDMARFLGLLRDGSIVSRDASALMLSILRKQQVTGRLDLYLPVDSDCITLAHKTGDLDRLEHAVGIISAPRREYSICVLTNDMESNKAGREAIGEISRAVYGAFGRPALS